MIEVEIANEQQTVQVDSDLWKTIVRRIAEDAGFATGIISIAVVDDPTIHDLNRMHLAHDYPTDVLSFVLNTDQSQLEGEVIVSADTATERSAEFGMTPAAELLLYVIHGVLHLVGYRDKKSQDREQMRRMEQRYLDLASKS